MDCNGRTDVALETIQTWLDAKIEDRNKIDCLRREIENVSSRSAALLDHSHSNTDVPDFIVRTNHLETT